MSQPTPRQLEAYNWTYIVGLSNQDAAERMGLSPQRVGQLLKEFFNRRPALKVNSESHPENAISYHCYMDNGISRKF